MNICFLSGKIISEINFNFVYNNNKHFSYVKFNLDITEKNSSIINKKSEIIELYAYDYLADYIFSNYAKGQEIIATGRIEGDRIKLMSLHNFF